MDEGDEHVSKLLLILSMASERWDDNTGQSGRTAGLIRAKRSGFA